jgi:hypothetical protein
MMFGDAPGWTFWALVGLLAFLSCQGSSANSHISLDLVANTPALHRPSRSSTCASTMLIARLSLQFGMATPLSIPLQSRYSWKVSLMIFREPPHG